VKSVILCDFDGTITAQDVTNTLCRSLIPERWAEVEQMWLNGQISATECYELEYEALNLRKEDIDAFLATVPISPGLERLLAVAKKWRWQFHVLSAGFDYYIESILGRRGIEVPYTANHLYFADGGKPRFEFLKNDDPNCHRYKHPCAGCKPATWEDWKRNGYRIAYIGDGSTDFCMADHLKVAAEPGDLLFAKGHLLEYCRERDIEAIPYETLGEVADRLEEILRDEEPVLCPR